MNEKTNKIDQILQNFQSLITNLSIKLNQFISFKLNQKIIYIDDKFSKFQSKIKKIFPSLEDNISNNQWKQHHLQLDHKKQKQKGSVQQSNQILNPKKQLKSVQQNHYILSPKKQLKPVYQNNQISNSKTLLRQQQIHQNNNLSNNKKQRQQIQSNIQVQVANKLSNIKPKKEVPKYIHQPPPSQITQKNRDRRSVKTKNNRITSTIQGKNIIYINDTLQNGNRIKIKLQKIKYWITIGIVSKHAKQNQNKLLKSGWFSYRSNKDARIGQTFFQNQGKGMTCGDIVQVVVDYQNGDCKWQIGQKVIFAIRNQNAIKKKYLKPFTPFTPFICFQSKDDSVVLLQL